MYLLKNILAILVLSIGYVNYTLSQNTSKPKLVLGIVIDQMAFNNLYKYESRYGEGGFKRLLKEGYNFKNTHVNYVPSETAPGHAAIYTGTTPAYHGIIGNSWFDRVSNVVIGNVADTASLLIGPKTKNIPAASPKNLMTNSIADELRIASNFKSKVISISLKDRGAILPAGKSANAAYWHDWRATSGHFVTSSHYMKALPKWVKNFNKLERSDAFLDQTWNTLYPIETYTSSTADSTVYEPAIGGKPAPTFPYEFKSIREKYKANGTEHQLLWASPWGNTLLTEFAIEALKNEALGTDEYPDLLNISYSVPDVIGHTFGPQSVEMEDIYLRLDKDLAILFDSLDMLIGNDDYVVFLTADHGAISNAAFLADNKIETGVARIDKYKVSLHQYLGKKYGKNNWIQYFEGNNIYLNKAKIDENNLSFRDVQDDVVDFMVAQEGVFSALSAHDLQTQNYEDGHRQIVQNGYYSKRSGDIVLTFDFGVVQNINPRIKIANVKGTVHGSAYSYDTHIPLLFMGKGIPKGESIDKTHITDIAPTLAMLLNVQIPSVFQGHPLGALFEE